MERKSGLNIKIVQSGDTFNVSSFGTLNDETLFALMFYVMNNVPQDDLMRIMFSVDASMKNMESLSRLPGNINIH